MENQEGSQHHVGSSARPQAEADFKAMNSMTAGIPTLRTGNFLSWSEMVQMSLRIRKLHSALEEGEVDENIDLMACMVLKGTMDEMHLGMVRGSRSAKDIMLRLQTAYSDKSAANKYRLIQQFYRYSKVASDSMGVHIGKMDELRNNLRDLGEKLSETVFQAALISSLPKEFSSIMENWELTHESMRTTQNLVALLIKREADMTDQGVVSQDQAFLSQARQDWQPTMTIEERKKRTNCNRCGQLGHWARECRRGKKQSSNVQSTAAAPAVAQASPAVIQSPPAAPAVAPTSASASNSTSLITRSAVMFNVGSSLARYEDEWIIDSGASSHMANNKKWFKEIEILDLPGSCSVGDGRSLRVLGKGIVYIDAVVDRMVFTRILKDVLYIPELSTNLVSIGAAANSGVMTTFTDAKCTLSQDGLVVAQALKVTDNLYFLQTSSSCIAQVLIVRGEKKLIDYHRILGHASERRVKMLLEQLGIRVSPGDKISCPDCAEGKAHHVPHPSIGLRASKPGVLHVDLSGIINKTSLEGFKYYLLCKDAFTNFVMVYHMSSKSQVPELLLQMVVDFEHLSGSKVSEVHSDCGSEFVNQITRTLWLKEHIKHVVSAPYCPEQNGRIEREMRTINTSARALMQASGLDGSLWPHAVGCAVYMKNRLPTASSTTTPFEMITGRKPSINHLVEFGEQVHVLRNWDYLTKWDSRTVPGFVVGFTQRSNTYQVYVPARKSVIQTCDIVFAEHKKQASEELKQQADEKIVPLRNRATLSAGDEDDFLWKSGRPKADTQGGHHIQEEEEPREQETGDDRYLTSNENEPLSSTPVVNRSVRPNQKQLCTGEALREFFEDYRRENAPELEAEDGPQVPVRVSSLIDSSMRPIESVPAVGEIPAPEAAVDNEEVPEEPEANASRLSLHDHDYCQLTTQTGATPPVACDTLEPRDYQGAVTGPNNEAWKTAIACELKAHSDNQTWTVAERPSRGVLVSTKWIFTLKRDNEGKIERFKARVVARGFEQIRGVDYGDTYAPVARTESLRTLLALIALKDWHFRQFDVSTAFLHGDIDRLIHIEPPLGVDVESSKCLRLNKALYGLKQAPKCWNLRFNQVVNDLGFKPTITDSCVYRETEGEMILIIYVDDGLVIGPDPSKCDKFIEELNRIVAIRKLSGDCFIGMQIMRQPGKLMICQARYTKDIIARFNMKEAMSVSAPMLDTKDLYLHESDEIVDVPYRELLGCLQFLGGATRPDILFAVNFLARFTQRPKQKHWTALKRVLRYLIGTIDYMIEYQYGGEEINSYSDADWANDLHDRKSVSGVLIMIAGAPVIFASRKQDGVSQSSTEAEYISACETAKELTWLAQLLSELKIERLPVHLYIDNQSTIRQIKSGDTQRRSKHVELKYHFVRQKYQEELFSLEYINTNAQPADLLTKPINGAQTTRLLMMIRTGSTNMRNSNHPIIKGAVAKVAFILLCILATSEIVSSVFEESEDIILLDTPVKVVQGINQVLFNMGHRSACENVTERSWDTTYNVSATSFQGLKGLCENFYEDNLIPAYEEFGNCFTPENDGLVSRFKREILTAIMVIFSVATAVVTATGAIVNWVVSSNDREELHKTDAEIKEKIEEIEAKNNVSAEIRQNTINSLNETRQDVAKNKLAIIHLAQYTPNLSWEAADLITRMKLEKISVNQLTATCKKGRLNVYAMFQLTVDNQLSGIEESDTHMLRTRVVNKNIVQIAYYNNIISKDTKVHEVRWFPRYEGIGSEATILEYKGPRYLIYNTTSSCVKGIEDVGTQTTVFEECTEQGYTDPRLKHWVLNKTIKIGELAPKAYRTGATVHISCFGHEIKLKEKSRPCPHYPFKQAVNVPYDVPGLHHRVNTMHLTDLGKPMILTRLRVNNNTDNAYDRGNRFLLQAALQNDMASQGYGYRHQPNESLTLVHVIVIVCSILTCIGLVIKLIRYLMRNQPFQTAEVHKEQVTVNINQSDKNEAPPQALLPDYPTLSLMQMQKRMAEQAASVVAASERRSDINYAKLCQQNQYDTPRVET